MKPLKKYIIFIVILLLLVPLGIYIPYIFKSQGAWGEWSPEQVKEKTGNIPEGMKTNAALYKAPLENYTLNHSGEDLKNRSLNYYISGLLGTLIIFIITFGVYKIYLHRRK